MTTLPSGVLGDTTKLITPEVATMPELGRCSWMPWRHERSMPEVATMYDLGRYYRGALSGVQDY